MLDSIRKKLAKRHAAAQLQRVLRDAEPRVWADLQAISHHRC